ncbi:MAG TPA: SMC-Scp complex subunit ScpB [Dehalococcoidia bacterium]|jgi:segregation and condensation protein B|nr:SMC-Scp complex subunit ScpB [Dehalococcoidia bacterium]
MPPDQERPADAPPPPDSNVLPAVIEALLFVSEDPVPAASLARTLDAPRKAVDRALDVVAESLAERGVRLQIGPDGAQIVTSPETSRWVQYFLGLEAQRRLSNAALETLAIIAYQQPVTRATIESIRGVNSDGSVATLRARGLVDDAGRAPGPGRAALFVTTQRFLEHFGLERPQDMPALGDIETPPPDAPQPMSGLDSQAEGSQPVETNAPEDDATDAEPTHETPEPAGSSGESSGEAEPDAPEDDETIAEPAPSSEQL